MKWAFLDTETTGLAGGTGTYAFLIGVGSIDAAGFRLRQFFMRDYGEEASPAARGCPSTWRSSTCSSPTTARRTTSRCSRPASACRARRHPFDRMEHLDLLFGARRLWKLRLESCRLVDLENQILGVERAGRPARGNDSLLLLRISADQAGVPVGPDLPSQRDRHSVAGLPDGDRAVRRSGRRKTRRLRHGADLIGLARWLQQAERHEEALRLFRRAVEMGLPDALLFRTLWDIAAVEKRLARTDAALAVITELAASRNPYRVRALEELAKHYEHRERNYVMALEMTRSALEIADTPEIRRREARLKNRVDRPRTRKLAL